MSEINATLDKIEELLNNQENDLALQKLDEISKEPMDHKETARHAHFYGVVLSRLGKISDAIMQFRRSKAAAEKDGDKAVIARADEYLGSAYHQRQRYNEAHLHYINALQIYTELGDIAGQGRGHRNLGNLFVDTGKVREATYEYEKSCELFRQIEAYEDMAPAILHRSAMIYQKNGLKASLESYRDGIEKDKCNHYLVLNNYGFMLMLNNQIDDAVIYLQKAAEDIENKKINDDDLALVCLNIGIAYALSDKLTEAEKYLHRSADLLEKYDEAKAIEFLLQPNEKYADKGFSKYLIVDNGSKKSLAHLNLAAVLVWQNRLEEAKAEIAKGIEADRNAGYPHLSAGWVYLAAGMEQEASTSFHRACGFEPQNEEFQKALNLVNPYAHAKVGRNDPCPCGSGKKFKKCHGV
ncbi:tetratricopeptide repeat protein [bacterium]|nr:tetratricopeptide repeat protein [bacterium]